MKAVALNILVTNDDGIEADGLEALVEAAQRLPGAQVTVLAPAFEQSQCGHRVTTREPLKVERCAGDRFKVGGTPADCVRVALFGLGLKPDLVLSGINHGGNMGQDLPISGTVAAVREAAYHGVPAIAFSHYLIRDLSLDWLRIGTWVDVVLNQLQGESLAAGEFWNVNFPHLPSTLCGVPEIVRTQPARSPLGVEFIRRDSPNEPSVSEFLYEASYSARPQDSGSDVEACFNGKISVSRVSLA